MDSTEPTFRGELIALIRKHNRNEGSGATPERLAQVMDATAPPFDRAYSTHTASDGRTEHPGHVWNCVECRGPVTTPPPAEPRDESLTEPA